MEQEHAIRWKLDTIYYHTATINGWKHLMKEDQYKDIVISSFQHLVKNEFIRLYGYVIMPNHIHMIAEMLKKNRTEFPLGSMTKFTGHVFKETLEKTNQYELQYYLSDKRDRNYQFWKIRPYPFEIYSRPMMIQKLDYIHHNPVQPQWNLCNSWDEYRYSSARFYEHGIDEFGILTHYLDYV